MAKFCKNCGAALEEGARFCEGCGNADAASTPPKPAPKDENVCPSCGYVRKPGANFCRGCGNAAGAPQPAPKQEKACPTCGYVLKPGAKFCKGCGTKIGEAAVPILAQPQSAYAPFVQPDYQQQTQQAPPPKKSGKKLLTAAIVGAAAVMLIITSIIVIPKMIGGGDSGNTAGITGSIERGKSASAKDGKIELDGTKLDFGGNNVTNATKLTVLIPTVNEEPNCLISKLYGMELNAACTSPVTVSIPFDTSLLPTGEDAEDTSVMIGLGSRFPDGNDGTYTIYNYIPAEVEDGAATAVFVPADYMQNMYITGNNGGKRAPDDVWLSFGVFTVTARYEGGHFKILYSNSRSNAKVTRADCSAILNDLESAYEFFLSKGYDYSKRTKWPLEVNLGNYGNPGEYTMGGVINKLYLNQWDGWINLEDRFFIGGYRSDMMKPTIYHEFFHVVQSMYVTDYATNRWFDEATSSYWEWSVKGAMPDNVQIRLELLFEGLPSPDERAASGYVRSALLKYVIDKQLGGDDGFIRDMYEAQPGDWNAAFVSATLPYGDYATGFFTDFLAGGYGLTASACYNDITSGKMAKAGISKEMQLPDKDILDKMRANGEDIPPLAAATASVGAYGAQLVALPVYLETLEKLTDEDAVIFSARGDCDFRVFEISTDFGRATTVHVPNSAGEVAIAGFNQSTKNYMVLVVGLHDTSKRDCDVIVELAEKGDDISGRYIGTSSYTVTDSAGSLTSTRYLRFIIRKSDENPNYYLIRVQDNEDGDFDYHIWTTLDFTGQLNNGRFTSSDFTGNAMSGGTTLHNGTLSLEFSETGDILSGTMSYSRAHNGIHAADCVYTINSATKQ